jgi:hypothetical protein
MTRHRDGRPDKAAKRRERLAQSKFVPRLVEVVVWAALAALVYFWVGPAVAVGVAALAVASRLAGFRIDLWLRKPRGWGRS